MSADSLLHATRAEQRRLRLLEAERELAAEEADALTLTEEQRQTLLRPFAAVKAEFADLDGLRWTQTALRRRQPSHRRAPAPAHPAPDPSGSAMPATANAFAVLTNADLAAFAPDDTIRAPHPPSRTRPRFPSPLIRGTASLPSTPTSPSDLATHPPRPPAGHRDGTRTRSPVKGLFSRDIDTGDIDWPLDHAIEVMDAAGGSEDADDGVYRPPPPGLAQAPRHGAAESSARRFGPGVLLESPPAARFPSSLLDAPPHRSAPVYHSAPASSSKPSTSRALSRTASASASPLSIQTTAHHLPRRQASKHGVPRPTRHAPSPPPSAAHLTPDDDDDDDPLALLEPPPPSSLLERPPLSSILSHPPTYKPRPLSRSASFYITPSSSPPSLSHVTAPHPTRSSAQAHPSPRARLASLLAHTPTSPTAPHLSRARASSSASPTTTTTAAASSHLHTHPHPSSPHSPSTPHSPSNTTNPHPPGLRGWAPDPPSNAHPTGNANTPASSTKTNGGGGYTSDDDDSDADPTPRASPVDAPGPGGAGGRSPSRGWIRGFA